MVQIRKGGPTKNPKMNQREGGALLFGTGEYSFLFSQKMRKILIVKKLPNLTQYCMKTGNEYLKSLKLGPPISCFSDWYFVLGSIFCIN